MKKTIVYFSKPYILPQTCGMTVGLRVPGKGDESIRACLQYRICLRMKEKKGETHLRQLRACEDRVRAKRARQRDDCARARGAADHVLRQRRAKSHWRRGARAHLVQGRVYDNGQRKGMSFE